MKKILIIAWKDLIMLFRDPAALLMMLLTPFALSLVIGFAFGGFGGQRGSTLTDIPILIVNHDPGQLGESLVAVFQSEELADLVEPALAEDEAAAKASVDADETAAAVIIPANLTSRVIPQGTGPGEFEAATQGEPARIVIYTNPTRPVSASVARSIVAQYLNQVNAAAAGGRVTVEGLLENGLLSQQELQSAGLAIGQRAGEQTFGESLIQLQTEAAGESADPAGFDWVAYMAPSLAIMFLMFTTTAGGRTILAEREGGTLPRMLVSPSTAGQVLGGKVLGIFLMGVLQLSLLALASRFLLGLSWGDPRGVALLILAVVFAATGWGILLAAYCRTPGQVNTIGTALALVFGASAGNLVPRQVLPEWLQTASYISPNAWGLEGFAALIAGVGWQEILLPVAALTAMGLLLFGISLLAFRRQYA
jgi:ABC-2 type transport system permease protein